MYNDSLTLQVITLYNIVVFTNIVHVCLCVCVFVCTHTVILLHETLPQYYLPCLDVLVDEINSTSDNYCCWFYWSLMCYETLSLCCVYNGYCQDVFLKECAKLAEAEAAVLASRGMFGMALSYRPTVT